MIFHTKDQTFLGVLGKDAMPKLMPLFVEFVLRNAKILETIIVHVGSELNETRFKELHQVASTLSRSNNVIKIKLILCFIGGLASLGSRGMCLH